jgi:hypothetical protein
MFIRYNVIAMIPMNHENERQTEDDGPLTDRLLALLSLASRKPHEGGQHLSEEKMQAFVQGALDDAGREEVLAHINACEQCRQDWLVLSDPGRRMLEESAEKVQSRQPTTTEKVVPITRRRERTGWMAAIGFAMAASLLAIVFWPSSPTGLLPESLDELYRMHYQKIDQASARLAQQLTFPLQDPSLTGYGFSSRDDSYPDLIAFAAGLWQGSEDIRTKGKGPVKPLPIYLRPAGNDRESVDPYPWQGTDWEVYTSLGRWIVLLRTGCSISGDEQREYSIRQREVGLMLSEVFRQRSEPQAHRILKGLERLGESLDGYKAGRSVSALCRGIEEDTEQLITLLSP